MRRREAPTAELAYPDAESGVKPSAGLVSARRVHPGNREVAVPRGRPRLHPVPETGDSVADLAEAKRRGLWAIYRVRPGFYACARAGEHCAGRFVGWAIDQAAAKRAGAALAREDRYPAGGRHQGAGSRP